MPRFFFDTDDAIQFVTDEHGSELPDLAAARHLARMALTEMMVDLARERDAAQCRAVVRDEAGTRLFTTRVTLSIDEDAEPSA